MKWYYYLRKKNKNNKEKWTEPLRPVRYHESVLGNKRERSRNNMWNNNRRKTSQIWGTLIYTSWKHNELPIGQTQRGPHVVLWTELCPLQCSYVETLTKYNGIWKWGFGRQLGLDEILRMDFHNRTGTLIWRNIESMSSLSLSLPWKLKRESVHLQARKRALSRRWKYCHLDLRLGFPELWEN